MVPALTLLLAVISFSCAQQAAPQGGPRDEVAPTVLKSSPAIGTLNYRGRELLFRFDEPIRKPAFDKEIFISPLVERPEIRISDNARRLSIKFAEDLRSQTTYIVTLNGVADNSEGNKLTEPYVLAFSTGDVLDSLSFNGQIWKPLLGKGAAEMTVLLFDADSAINNDFLRKRPAYLTRADQQGRFSFQYLRAARYRLLGLNDADQSNSYSLPTEEIALSADTVFYLLPTSPDSLGADTLRLDTVAMEAEEEGLTADSLGIDSLAGDSLRVDSLPVGLDSLGQDSVGADTLVQDSLAALAAKPDVVLYAFVPDEKGPQIRSYDLLNARTARINLSERPRLDWLTAWSTDTTGQDSTPLDALSLYQEDEDFKVLVHLPPSLPADLHLIGLSDSLGNAIDTVLRITERPFSKLERPILTPPTLNAEAERWEILLPRVWDDTLTEYIRLTDTAQVDSNRKQISLAYKSEGFYVYLAPESLPDPEAPYVLRIEGHAAAMRDSMLRDSLFAFRLAWFDTANYGSLSGGITLDSAYTGPIWLQLFDTDGKLVAEQADTSFYFSRLLAGEYSFRVILDADSNQTWTPGQLHPLRLPERIYLVPDKLSLRANWEFEDFRVEVRVTDEQAANNAATAEPEEGDGQEGAPAADQQKRPTGLGGRP